MSITISSISPARISPVSTGTLTVVGSGFTGVDVFTVEGRACTDIAIVDDSHLTCTWPIRVTSGVYTWTADSVSVVATNSMTHATGASTVEYMIPVDAKIMQYIANRVASSNTNAGYFYNYSASQFCGFNVDPNTWPSNGLWPRVIGFLGPQRYVSESTTAGQRVYRGTGYLISAKPLLDINNFQNESLVMASDLTKMIYSDLSLGGYAYNVDVVDLDQAFLEGLANGSLFSVCIQFDFDFNQIENDPTQQTVWTIS